MNLVGLTIIFPLLGYIALAISQGSWSTRISTIIGVGSISVSAFITVYVIFDVFFNTYNDKAFVYIQEFWTWFAIGDLYINIAFRLDGLSIVMLSIITGIGLIIHIYAVWYMHEYEGYSRFFAYTNLFIFNMILLVLSDNLLLMYFGWEGVGLCSYLLIGFYHDDVKNGMAALKAFIMTRFGDICLLCSFFMIYDQYNTLSISVLLNLQEKCLFPIDVTSSSIRWISVMLLIGAVAKSAQFPLHTWLTSAMVGPIPVSALIHAATMVTSGVYLICRLNKIFLMVPGVLYVIGIIGAVTLILFGCSALLQSDIKKILAYSTISQIGYMFLALGGGDWAAAMFHLTTHAFFKSLLFLAAGSLIYICNKEQDIFKMGGLYKSIPLIYICFLIGGASLSAFPIITAGFYSKELILLKTLVHHNYFFWISGLIGEFLTSVYIFRMIFIVFHGEQNIKLCVYSYNIFQNFPLIILLLLSTYIGGLIKLPFSYMELNVCDVCHYDQIYFQIISGVIIIFGIWLASYFWLNPSVYNKIMTNMNFARKGIIERYVIVLCYYGWGLDTIYRTIFVKPYLLIISIFSYGDPIDFIVDKIISFFDWIRKSLIYSVNGKLHWYIVSMNIGSIIVLIVTLTYMNSSLCCNILL